MFTLVHIAVPKLSLKIYNIKKSVPTSRLLGTPTVSPLWESLWRLRDTNISVQENPPQQQPPHTKRRRASSTRPKQTEKVRRHASGAKKSSLMWHFDALPFIKLLFNPTSFHIEGSNIMVTPIKYPAAGRHSLIPFQESVGPGITK